MSKQTTTTAASTGIQKVIVKESRGHVQRSVTLKELRAFTKLKGAAFVVQKEELDASMTTATEEQQQNQGPDVCCICLGELPRDTSNDNNEGNNDQNTAVPVTPDNKPVSSSMWARAFA